MSEGTVGQKHISNKRASRPYKRATLACNFCRKRKSRCSGELPICRACRQRRAECVYPGQPNSPIGPIIEHVFSDDTPPEALVNKAIVYFREHYAPTLLCFIPPHQLIVGINDNALPLPLTLCILALVSKFLPDNGQSQTPISKISDHYAELAQKALAPSYDKPTLLNIQCCLILCIYEIGEGAEHTGWIRLGHAIRLAQLLKLHQMDYDSVLNYETPSTMSHTLLLETMRRTFWCCFCFDKLLANGRDRIAVLSPNDITTRLPQSDDDFIYERDNTTCRLNCEIHPDQACGLDSIFSYTVRVVGILGDVAYWHGRKGRRKDARCPWLSEMPFSVFDKRLLQWRSTLPNRLDYKNDNFTFVVAAGKGKIWSMMFMFYFQARADLYRKYVPSVPTMDYDPATGPCDGPDLIPADEQMPPDWWQRSAKTMIKCSNIISDLYARSQKHDLSVSAYPFAGLCLLTAASIHTIYSIFEWNSMRSTITPQISRSYLRQDMESFNHLGQHWSLSIHWIRQVSKFYKMNSLVRRSWTKSDHNLQAVSIAEVSDGITNYILQISQQDRVLRDKNLKPEFDFDGWLSALDDTIREPEDSDLEALSTDVDIEGSSSRAIFDSLVTEYHSNRMYDADVQIADNFSFGEWNNWVEEHSTWPNFA